MQPVIAKCCANDIFCIIDEEEDEHDSFKPLNNFHLSNKHTVELEIEQTFSFLDVELHQREDGTIAGQEYHTLTWTGQLLILTALYLSK